MKCSLFLCSGVVSFACQCSFFAGKNNDLCFPVLHLLMLHDRLLPTVWLRTATASYCLSCFLWWGFGAALQLDAVCTGPGSGELQAQLPLCSLRASPAGACRGLLWAPSHRVILPAWWPWAPSESPRTSRWKLNYLL